MNFTRSPTMSANDRGRVVTTGDTPVTSQRCKFRTINRLRTLSPLSPLSPVVRTPHRSFFSLPDFEQNVTCGILRTQHCFRVVTAVTMVTGELSHYDKTSYDVRRMVTQPVTAGDGLPAAVLPDADVPSWSHSPPAGSISWQHSHQRQAAFQP